MARILIIFDTRYGGTMKLAVEVAEGVKGIEGAEPVTRRVAIWEPEEIIRQNGRWERAQAQFGAMAEVSLDDLESADAIICGSPTRFGGMTAAMKALWDSTGQLWVDKKLYGKVGAVFSTTGTPHGGNEMTLFSMIVPMMHHGMVIVAPGYGHPTFYQTASPYGATAVTGPGGDHDPDEATCRAAMFLGQRVAEVTLSLVGRPAVKEVR